jgi:carbon-monoxide dehydrogenase small subunit
MRIELNVNGEQCETDVWEGESLLYALRERLGFPGSKNACEQGECGSCSVLFDGKLVCSCLVLAAQAEGHPIVTIEGLAEDGRLHKVQEAFVATGAVQCGFCTPGLVVATADLLAHNVYPRTTTSARRCPGISAAAPGTPRSSTRCGRRRRPCRERDRCAQAAARACRRERAADRRDRRYR